MTLSIHATVQVGDVNYTVQGASVGEITDAIAALRGNKPEAAAAPTPAKEAKATGKSAKSTEPPASSPPPAPETPKAESAASSKKDEKPASIETDYLKTGIGEALTDYVGIRDSEGYADRRAKAVALLKEFGVAKGPELKPEQFAEFKARVDKLAAPVEDDGALG